MRSLTIEHQHSNLKQTGHKKYQFIFAFKTNYLSLGADECSVAMMMLFLSGEDALLSVVTVLFLKIMTLTFCVESKINFCPDFCDFEKANHITSTRVPNGKHNGR